MFQFFWLFLALLPPLGHSYTGTTSTEAVLSFRHWVMLPEGENSRKAAEYAIEEQLSHVFGAISMGTVRGAPKLDHEITGIRLEENRGRVIARYNYRGSFVLEKSRARTLSLPLPIDPATIWQVSEENKRGRLNPCTDPHYQSPEDFFYFWNPARKGCEGVLKEGRDYTYVTAQVERIQNTKTTYPEYEKLADRNDRIIVTVLMGKDEPSRIRSPYNRKARAKDANAQNFAALARRLEKLGFEGRVWSNEEVKEIVRVPLRLYPFVKEYRYRYGGERARELAVRLVYTTTDIASDATGFHYFLENAMEKSAVMIYDGHSGLGANLDLASIREAVENKFRFNLDKRRYQIYFMNSCTSYAYFNDSFFAKKATVQDPKGSRYLDILTTGLETAFEGGVEVNMSLIGAIHEWAETGRRTSYQELAAQMEADNLFGVNGDEDNPTR